jgi:hypothetical protein
MGARLVPSARRKLSDASVDSCFVAQALNLPHYGHDKFLAMKFGDRVEIHIVTDKGGAATLPIPNDDYLEALREFIDFVNRQVGVYMDAIGGFAGNKTRIEFQAARVRRRFSGGKGADGSNIVMSSSLEDPTRPGVILNRISRVVDYLADNSEGGFNEQQQARATMVFIFSYWDEEIRPRLARARNVSPNEIRVNALGDLRLLRGSIIHNKSVLAAGVYEKLSVMQDLFAPDHSICVTHDSMHQIFVRVKQGVGQLILEHVGPRPGAPQSSEIKDVAIQRLGRNNAAGESGANDDASPRSSD